MPSEKSSNGPDWTDVAMMVNALDTLHECRTGILITAGSQGHNGGLHITITSVFAVLGGTTTAREVRSDSEWPCPDCRTLEGHVYGGLYAHDYAIGEAYQQRFLPGT